MECLNCKKEVQQTPKKRAKLYCSQKCRVEYCRTKKAAGKPKIGRGRPKKANTQLPKFSELPIVTPSKEAIKTSNGNLSEYLNNTELFMGHEIPKGLKGIDLSIWKAEIKEANKK